MQQVKNFFLSLLFFIGFSVLGIAVGVGIGYIVVVLSNEGLFSSWKLLDGPHKFEQIAEVTSQTIWAKTADGKLYSWDSNCYRETNCDRWIITSKIPTDIHEDGEIEMQKGNSCEERGYKFFRKPPGTLIECARGWFAGPEFGTVVYYALLDDGKIWVWRHSGSMIFDIVLSIFFSLGGLIVGIVTFIVFMIRRRRKNKNQGILESNSLRENFMVSSHIDPIIVSIEHG